MASRQLSDSEQRSGLRFSTSESETIQTVKIGSVSIALTIPKPRAFIGSSGSALKVAKKIRAQLSRDFDVKLWTDPGAFPPSTFPLEALLDSVRQSDFGVFVLSTDDLLESKGELSLATRDNVLFESGLFFGARGKSGTFLFAPDIPDLHIATDLEGLTQLRFIEGNVSSLRKKCEELKAFCVGELRTPETKALTGVWRQSWHVMESANFPKENPSEACVAAFGRRWIAHFFVGDKRYTFEANIRGNHITGNWFGPTKHDYYGVAQLVLSRNLDRASGVWTGFRSNNLVSHGDWHWQRSKEAR